MPHQIMCGAGAGKGRSASSGSWTQDAAWPLTPNCGHGLDVRVPESCLRARMRTAVPETFIAYSSRWRLALLSLLALGFVVLGLWFVGSFGPVPASRRSSYGETLIIGWTCILVFSLCILLSIPRFFEAGEQLRIDVDGITYRQWSDATIPWSQIISVTEYRYQSSRFIVLHLKDRRSFPGKGLAALLAGVNRIMTGGDICISLRGTDRSYDEAVTAINQYRSFG